MNVFAYTISLELHTFVILLFAKEKEKIKQQQNKQTKMVQCLAAIESTRFPE